MVENSCKVSGPFRLPLSPTLNGLLFRELSFAFHFFDGSSVRADHFWEQWYVWFASPFTLTCHPLWMSSPFRLVIPPAPRSAERWRQQSILALSAKSLVLKIRRKLKELPHSECCVTIPTGWATVPLQPNTCGKHRTDQCPSKRTEIQTTTMCLGCSGAYLEVFKSVLSHRSQALQFWNCEGVMSNCNSDTQMRIPGIPERYSIVCFPLITLGVFQKTDFILDVQWGNDNLNHSQRNWHRFVGNAGVMYPELEKLMPTTIQGFLSLSSGSFPHFCGHKYQQPPCGWFCQPLRRCWRLVSWKRLPLHHLRFSQPGNGHCHRMPKSKFQITVGVFIDRKLLQSKLKVTRLRAFTLNLSRRHLLRFDEN